MKKIFLFIALLLGNKLYADDTAALQAMIDAGNTVLPTHHAPYSITRLRLSHNLNANGNTFNCTLAVGRAIVMDKPGVKFSNAELVGMDDSTNPDGTSGVYINADNDTVTHVYIHKFTAYGIIGGWGNVPVVTFNRICDIGYVGFFYISDKRSIKGGTVAFDTIDRSMLSAETVTQGALLLRGSKEFTSTGWKVHHNLFMMPYLPKDITSECFELRFAPNSQIYNNNCNGGSIGISVVRNDFVRTYHNKCTRQKEEGIEYADSNNGLIKDNTITEQAGLGVLIDGFPPVGCQFDTLLNNTIQGCKSFGIQLYKDTHDILISNCTISTSSKAIYLQAAYGVNIRNCRLTGTGGGTVAVFLDNSVGKVSMKGGSLNGFGHKFFVYGNKGVVSDDISTEGVKVTGKMSDIDNSLSGGAAMGTNIRVK
ncbi:MAG: right-handed parallel beta-helix repeat-containing protein [Sphingobacteriales bacterium]